MTATNPAHHEWCEAQVGGRCNCRESIRLSMTERELQDAVLDLAGHLHWLTYHTHDSRRSQPGFPDLVLVRPPRLVFVELKSETGRVTAAQQFWLDQLREVALTLRDTYGRPGTPVEAVVWRPEQWRDGTIEAALR